jgi:hypothetical protein
MRRRLLLANSHGSGWSEKTMTFYVNSVAYTAFEGMTWGDWIASEFNVDAFFLDMYGRVHDDTGKTVTTRENKQVVSSDYIMADYNY